MSDAVIENFRMLPSCNLLANARLYEACAKLPDAERKERRAAFFGSIHATLNHLMVGDRIRLARFSDEEVPSTGLDTIPSALTQRLGFFGRQFDLHALGVPLLTLLFWKIEMA